MDTYFHVAESNIINGVRIIRASSTQDERGQIWTSFLKDRLEKLLPDELCFKHDKFSLSKQRVIRGIHGDYKTWKMVTCVLGEIYQVVIDLRKESNTYTKYETFLLTDKNHTSLLIPPGLGNAILVESDVALYHYKLAYHGNYVNENEQFSYKWNDPRFKIEWPIDNPILSDRDK